MEEITRPNPARSHSRSAAAEGRPRPHPLRATVILGMVLMPLLCALTFVAAAYASTATIRLPPVDSETLGQIAASFLPTPPSPIPPPTPTPLPTFQPPDPLATPIPLPAAGFASPTAATATPSAAPTETGSPSQTPSLTPTFTITPTFTDTYTATVTASVTPSPTPTTPPTATPTTPPTATRTPTSTSAAPTSTSAPPTATDPPAPTATSAPPTATPDPSCTPAPNAAYESTLLGLINQERNEQGLPSYTSQSELQAAARGHSTDMACNAFFSHTGSDGSNVGQRVNAQGYSWSFVGENIFATSDTSSNAPQSAFTWWMNSAPHRANLLNTNYTDIGIGYVYRSGSPYGGYFTAVFARP